MAVDATNHRLFLAALGNNSLEVVDLRAGKVIHSIGGLHEPQGVAFLKEENRIAVADGGDGTCRFFDATTYISNGSHGFQSDADNLRYDPIEKRLYVGFGGGAIGRIDMSNGKRLDDIQLSGHPESFQLERNGTRVYVNVPAARRIAVIDRQRAKVVATWPVLAEANFPMALMKRATGYLWVVADQRVSWFTTPGWVKRRATLPAPAMQMTCSMIEKLVDCT